MKICTKCKIPKLFKEFYKRNIETSVIYREVNIDKKKAYNKRYYHENYERERRRIREYEKSHKKERNRYENKRYKSNPMIRLKITISTGIYKSLKSDKSGNHWEELVGYTLNDLKKHLELQFKDDMTWNNYGRNGWHIDHKLPINKFNISSIECENFKRCWDLNNLQPLWEKDNISKKDKILPEFAQLKIMLE